jgi:hypothetical protein
MLGGDERAALVRWIEKVAFRFQDLPGQGPVTLDVDRQGRLVEVELAYAGGPVGGAVAWVPPVRTDGLAPLTRVVVTGLGAAVPGRRLAVARLAVARRNRRVAGLLRRLGVQALLQAPLDLPGDGVGDLVRLERQRHQLLDQPLRGLLAETTAQAFAQLAREFLTDLRHELCDISHG